MTRLLAAARAASAVFLLSGALSAFASPLGTAVLGYGMISDPGYGYNFISFPPIQVLGSFSTQPVAGTFLDGDNATEYVLDSSDQLFTMNTTTGEATLLGTSGLALDAHVSLASSNGAIYGITSDENCQFATLFVVDPTTGAAQIIGVTDHCVQSMTFDSLGNLYELDSADGVVIIDSAGTSTTLGPLGVALNDTSIIVIDPTNDGALYLIQFEASAGGGANEMYLVDEVTGSATLIGPLVGDSPIFALVLAVPNSDELFADGFD